MITHQKPYHKEFLQNFAQGGYGELDYELEAENQRVFQKEMEMRSCPVVIPDVFNNLTTQRVLTTQWMDGIRLSDAPPDTIRKLIPVGVELFLCQLLDIGAFHGEAASWICSQVCTMDLLPLTIFQLTPTPETCW